MNQDKIGKFITKCRKDKNMTQEQLAEKMGVSINAVSKWERGLSFPDVSLYKKLCKELNINIEELINGEKDKSDEAKEKAIISTINETNKIKKNTKKSLIILSVIFVTIICGLIYYNKNLKINLVTDSDDLYNVAIDYLREKEFQDNPDSNEKDFNIFFAYHGFGIEKKDSLKYAYMWIFNNSYYIEKDEYGGALAISSGMSVPCKITFKNNKVVKVEYPKDGNEYVSSIKNMFPSVIATQVLNFDKAENLNKLFNEVSERKNKYYDYLNLDMSKITIDDINYNDLLFTVNVGSKSCIPVQLNIYKDGKYTLYTHYKDCKSGYCTSDLNYTKSIEGKYEFDVIQIIKHSTDANNMQFNMENLPEYDIYAGNGYQFITDNDNKYLIDFLKSIDVDLTKCAEPDYGN